nr:PspC domain-containing protein [uncultured Sphingosinicella sp.]
MTTRKKFHLDKRNGKALGVCAGTANYLNIDATIVRIAIVLATVLGAAPWSLIAYLVVAMVAKPQPTGGFGAEEIGSTRASAHDLRMTMRDIDRRLAEVDSYVVSSNRRLSQEIDELR